MDIEKFREQWNGQEYAKSFPGLNQEPPMEIIRRKQQMRERAAAEIKRSVTQSKAKRFFSDACWQCEAMVERKSR
jgi:hypothetical protein